MEPTYKSCKTCGVAKAISDFPLAKYKDGREWVRGTCKACRNEAAALIPWKKPLNPVVEKKNHTGICSCCHIAFLQTSRFFRVRKQKNIKVYCSKGCSSKGISGENSAFYRNKGEQYNYMVEVNKVRKFDEQELKYSIHKAKHLLRSKDYFKGHSLCAETAVSNAFILMYERGYEYTRRQFYLLIWNSLGKERYANIKANPALYEQYRQRCNEYHAIARFKMAKSYLNTLLRNRKNPINPVLMQDESKAIYEQCKLQLQQHRDKSDYILKGERLQFYSHYIPNIKPIKIDLYEAKYGN